MRATFRDRLQKDFRVLSAIATSTWREWSRDRIFWVSFCVGGLLLVASLLAAVIDASQSRRILLSWGYTSLRFTLLPLAAILGVSLVTREIERRTVQLILSRGVGWSRLVFGKFFGVFGLLLLNGAILVCSVLLILGGMGEFAASAASFIQLATLVFFEALLLGGVALFFSSWMRSPLAFALSFTVWMVGHQHEWIGQVRERVLMDLEKTPDFGGRAFAILLGGLAGLPRFDRFVAEYEVNHSLMLPASEVLQLALYALGLNLLLVGFSGMILKIRSPT